MADRCDFSDLPADQCAHCKAPAAPRRDTAAEHRSSRIEARYRGQCAGCGEPFAVGAPIEYDPETGGWVAECCAMDQAVDW